MTSSFYVADSPCNRYLFKGREATAQHSTLISDPRATTDTTIVDSLLRDLAAVGA
jgi:hypothetical protein